MYVYVCFSSFDTLYRWLHTNQLSQREFYNVKGNVHGRQADSDFRRRRKDSVVTPLHLVFALLLHSKQHGALFFEYPSIGRYWKSIVFFLIYSSIPISYPPSNLTFVSFFSTYFSIYTLILALHPPSEVTCSLLYSSNLRSLFVRAWFIKMNRSDDFTFAIYQQTVLCLVRAACRGAVPSTWTQRYSHRQTIGEYSRGDLCRSEVKRLRVSQLFLTDVRRVLHRVRFLLCRSLPISRVLWIDEKLERILLFRSTFHRLRRFPSPKVTSFVNSERFV